ncbi:alpha-amylase family protein [Phyllobacterium sp. 21LDTY02-6]|uniref:alpha-amylase family protein n=1 Tax=Phyllobacterium sp. 21LDTY02-6 TaxID=2944903 RepID=UPI002021807D|nr:alpha-amylase family protein [Phyllobacterium sp. 21LDTY02-6]MCO4316295.1 alpha-amylase family protein [Phyllobacterium sp. 21LDTY02-6]
MTAPWFKDAIFYGIDVERFADGNGDGIGDFVGLTQRLGYLRDLGVTCIWLLPFFGSPDRDNGYDVSDFMAVNPKVGTREDFLAFLHKAGEHGIRVIIDLVVNHTSDQHPWFQAARRDEKSRYRDYYVWSGDPPPIAPGTVSIFPGEESTVWTYDEVARAYYFHKFYSFQPELNIANPEVREEILRIVDYWLSFGVSGFRLDAAPLIIGDNGLRQANPKDPHGVLRDLAAYIESRRPGALLLGEVNMPLEETKKYFGEGDQLGLLFNFMLACHVFAGLARESAETIYEALSGLPQPPENRGWANFLRNLDELDFSQVPADLKADVFAKFAPRQDMQVYGRGVRRRLAPMLGGDARRVALALSIIFSLRGPPLIVYGDEIGLGEDLEQEGRNAVRMPMQWSPARNAGFSSANASALPLKPVSEGPFSYKRINVTDQADDPKSLLNEVKRLISVRRRSELIRSGRVVRLTADNPAIFISGYEDADAMLLVAHNLSAKPVKASVMLNPLRQQELTDIASGRKYVVKKELALDLPPHGYCWLSSEAQD